jgi:sigma-B regulation protein RsbU (phosphoserine phosphatase)
VTALFAIYDPATRRFTYSRAGHNPPVWMRPKDNGWEMLRLDGNGGIPLGIMEDAAYGETTITLETGQTLVLYTDGITESMSPEGRMYGVEGIEASLTKCTGYPQCAIGHITCSLKEHEAGLRPRDDQTLIVMRAE